ncbi:hypothetical protein BT96DRAFT_1024158 [Gymnopus androsaceus JB14]|uniref:Uncharacterized protein n=1 Tax=Gymnopus androsaceus JB14 TaxID=1447944 RepID=A0A6A4H0G3_9AGAR|nr:hypothetical protein BT96DRAFT_1024158 [Gymnopus androsaceus JB14]
MVHEVVPVVYTENRRLKGAIWLLKTALAVEPTRVKKLQDDLNRKDIISLINGRVVQEVKKAPNHAPNHGYPYPSRTRGKIPAPYPSVNSWVGMGGYPDSQIHASPYEKRLSVQMTLVTVLPPSTQSRRLNKFDVNMRLAFCFIIYNSPRILGSPRLSEDFH